MRTKIDTDKNIGRKIRKKETLERRITEKHEEVQ